MKSWADRSRERARGLLARPPLEEGEGLVLVAARQVHTIGMTYPIDVVFCDDGWLVKHVIRSMKPNRVSRWVLGARYVIEVPAGAAAGVAVGDRLIVSEG